MFPNIKRFIIVIISLFLISLFLPNISLAENEFLVDSSVEYIFESDGKATVVHKITMENEYSNIYAKSYSLNLRNINPEGVTVRNEIDEIGFSQSKEGDIVSIDINFTDPVIGKGETQYFEVTYNIDDFATKTGEVWEITIPKLEDKETYRNYSVNLSVPKLFGVEAYVSPNPSQKDEDRNSYKYTFSKTTISESGVFAGFGNFQVYTFVLNYHLENPIPRSSSVEIPIPPDTAYQKVYINSIKPEPKKVVIDEDGNWLAVFDLKSKERIDAVVTGSVQIYSAPREIPLNISPNLERYLEPTQYWQVTDPSIIQIAQELRSPRAIYDYVLNTLTYDYDRVKPNVQRFGAVSSLNNPDSAICMEFTDLFITLARATGIPAREINGYAYTDNPEIQPLSLVADVLHAWPEYWDEERQVWVPVDPTWGSTSGIDFFDKLDLRHFTFVTHGTSDSKPYPPGSYKLGPNPQKDVFVNFGQLPKITKSYPEVKVSVSKTLPFIPPKLNISIKNPGPVAIYDEQVNVHFDNVKKAEKHINFLAPHSEETFTIGLPFSPFGTKIPSNVSIDFLGKKVEVPIEKQSIIIYNATIIFIVLLAILLVTLLVYKRVKKVKKPPIKQETPQKINEENKV